MVTSSGIGIGMVQVARGAEHARPHLNLPCDPMMSIQTCSALGMEVVFSARIAIQLTIQVCRGGISAVRARVRQRR